MAHTDEHDLSDVSTAQLLQVNRARNRAAAAVTSENTDSATPQIRQFSYATIALTLTLIGAVGGLFVGWMAPFSIAGLVFAKLAPAAPEDLRKIRVSVALGTAGCVFGVVWVAYYVLALG